MSILKLEKIGFKYTEDWTLKDISFDVRRGEFMGVLGPNGSGKTTLLRLIDGILRPREGRLWINGLAAAEMKRQDLARLIAVVPQDSQLVFPFTVQEIVLMGRVPHLGLWRFEEEKDFEIACEAMEMTDTGSLASRKLNALSSGERQRVLIARALATEPELLLLDEPTASIDSSIEEGIFDLLRELNKRMTIMLVSHDVGFISRYVTRVACLNRKLQCHETSKLDSRSLEALYGGPVQLIDHDSHLPTGVSHE